LVRAHEWDVSRRLARSPGGRRPWWVAHPVPARRPFRLEWESAGPQAVLVVVGDLDDVTAPRLEAFVAERPLAAGTVLVIDLGGVLAVGSVGLSVLLGVHRRCLQRGIDLRLRGAHPSVWRAFEVTGVDVVFAPAASAPVGSAAQELTLF
jgi:anti-anti-sigma factor